MLYNSPVIQQPMQPTNNWANVKLLLPYIQRWNHGVQQKRFGQKWRNCRRVGAQYRMCLQAGDGSAHIAEVEGPCMLTLCMCSYVLDTPQNNRGQLIRKGASANWRLSELKYFMVEVQRNSGLWDGSRCIWNTTLRFISTFVPHIPSEPFNFVSLRAFHSTFATTFFAKRCLVFLESCHEQCMNSPCAVSILFALYASSDPQTGV